MSYFMQHTMVVNEIKSNAFFRSMKMDLVILCLSICCKMWSTKCTVAVSVASFFRNPDWCTDKELFFVRMPQAMIELHVTWGARDGAVVRALASHQCGPGSNLGVDAICGLCLLLVLSFAPRGFSPGTPVFPSPQKPTFPNSNTTRNRIDEEPLWDVLSPNHHHHHHYYYYYYDYYYYHYYYYYYFWN